MYNKSEIMTRAHKLYRTGNYSKFGYALSQSWREAKKEAEKRIQGYIKAEEICAGDTLSIEYGNYSNFVTCTVENIESELCFGSYVVNAVNSKNMKVQFCIKPSETVIRLAQAVEMSVAA